MTVKCFFGCGRNLDPGSRYVWHRISGWERPGRAGGSDIAVRTRDGDTFACDDCVRQAQRGLTPGQRTLC